MEKTYVKKQIELSQRVAYNQHHAGYWIRKFIAFSLGINWYEVIVREIEPQEEGGTVFLTDFCITHKYDAYSLVFADKKVKIKEIYSNSDDDGHICIVRDDLSSSVKSYPYGMISFEQQIPIRNESV